MIDHPVIDVLMSFTNEEIKQFRRFINSPYFIRSETVGSLFELLIKFHPGFKSKRLTKEYISENIYKTEKYNDSTIRNALADLLDTCELFLMQENFRKNSTFSFDFLLKELRDKKLSNVFQKKSSEFDKKYSQIENVDSEYYLAKYKFELNKYNFYSLNEKVTGSNEVEKHFKEIFNSGLYITIHYIIEIISIYLTSVFYSIKFNKPLSENYLYTLIKTLNIENLEKIIKNSEHNFLVNIYISLLKAFESMNDVSYRDYKAILKLHIKKLGKDEIWFHYSNLINFCMLKIMNSQDRESYDRELFSLYDEIVYNDYYKNKKSEYLRFSLYRDILITALRQKKIMWVENFILTQSSKLHKSDRDNMMNLAYAYLFYEKGEFMQSWKYFNKIKIDYFFYKYDVKNYALKIYYELGYYEEALTLIENYKRFLERNEFISDSEKTRIKNFISYLAKLILFKVGQLPQKHFSTYRRRLDLTNDTMNRNWILQKYDEQATAIKQGRRAKSA